MNPIHNEYIISNFKYLMDSGQISMTHESHNSFHQEAQGIKFVTEKLDPHTWE
ncbi:hypothetical protein glysoja_024132 [Glycine soja]|uniref:Uncharacterized protein n=1 Tax=Glycine soja TaxID=3848 RepID=A0A0B2RLD6_GLYSO|nr:hypothetical protein glysoja_024132 [Glycine soja]